MTPQPEKKIYQNGCSLACVTWHLKNFGDDRISQEELFQTYEHRFREWGKEISRGVLDREELMRLTMLTCCSLRNYIHTQSHEDALHLFHKHNQNFGIGYVVHRKPTNHVLAIVGFHEKGLRLMEPDAGIFLDISCEDLRDIHDADYMLFFTEYI